MSVFLLVFFALYGALHLYAFLKVQAAFAMTPLSGIALALFMALMVGAPVLVRLSEKAGLEPLARLLSCVGYTWMGLLFLFASSAFALDCYRLLLWLTELVVRTDFPRAVPSGRFTFLVSLLSALTIAVYGYFEAKDIRTEKLVIRTPKLSKETGGLTIVQISDVHLGLIVREERLKRILEEVKKAHPDILVSTGDLVDGQINGLPGLAGALREITPRYGKYAITGNHEFYAGLDQALDFTRSAGFTVLSGEAVSVGGLINIAGVDDPAGRALGLSPAVSEEKLLSGLPRGLFTLLLKHRPLIDKKALGLFDLQLSGHVHKGQIFPFSIITWLYYPLHAGRLDLPGHALLYVSRGAGTWGPPIRFLSPPEVTVVQLVPAD
ncbi:MAG TPA: metallophosphoesterase [Thermodesulfovibrionales bacterium]|nr:metallophosphoesterase [Thermodesulfovibrionales bacterium]